MLARHAVEHTILGLLFSTGSFVNRYTYIAPRIDAYSDSYSHPRGNAYTHANIISYLDTNFDADVKRDTNFDADANRDTNFATHFNTYPNIHFHSSINLNSDFDANVYFNAKTNA